MSIDGAGSASCFSAASATVPGLGDGGGCCGGVVLPGGGWPTTIQTGGDGGTALAPGPVQERSATPELDQLLATLLPAPACLLEPTFDFVGWNETFAKVWDPAALPHDRRNLMWMIFADPAHRHTWVGRQSRSRILLDEFRAAAGRHAGDGRFAELVKALSEASLEFQTWWSQYEVRRSITSPITIRHPPTGIIKLNVIELRVGNHPSLTLVVYVPARSLDSKKVAALQ